MNLEDLEHIRTLHTEWLEGKHGVTADEVAHHTPELLDNINALTAAGILIAEARTWHVYNTRDLGPAHCAETVTDLLDNLYDALNDD